MLGLLARREAPARQEMLTTMLSSTAHALSETMVHYDGMPEAPLADTELHGFDARYRLYEAGDGWVFLAAPGERDLAKLVAAMAAHVELTLGDDDVLVAELAAAFRTRPAAEWERELRAAGIACVEVAPGPVEANYMDDGSPGQLCGMVTTAFHPTLDEHPRLAPLVTMSRLVGRRRRRLPRRPAHGGDHGRARRHPGTHRRTACRGRPRPLISGFSDGSVPESGTERSRFPPGGRTCATMPR